jgi:response regulator RpfG family c-di-GMP phosphodiesterase
MKLILNNGREIEGRIFQKLDNGIKFEYKRMMPYNNSTCLLNACPDNYFDGNVVETFFNKDIKEIIQN